LNFLSSWGDRRATLWIDEATGLFVGEVAEAYLTAGIHQANAEVISVITLMIDRLDVVRSSQGEAAARAIQAQVAKVIGVSAATIGVVAACYRNGLIVIIAPDISTTAAQKLAQSLRAAIAALGIANRELVAADHVTASAAVVTGRASGGPDRAKLLMKAIASVQRMAADGGNQMVSELA